jgi:MYXO-CTERM domain-containing protein
MARLTFLAFGSALALAMPSPAGAETVKLDTKLNPSQLKSACGKAGGDYIRGGNTWSCHKKCGEGTCTVSCDKEDCTGTTPSRPGNSTRDDQLVADVLSANLPAERPRDEPGLPWGLLGLAGLAGLLALRRK